MRNITSAYLRNFEGLSILFRPSAQARSSGARPISRWGTALVLVALMLSSTAVPAFAIPGGPGAAPDPTPTAGAGTGSPDLTPGPVAAALAQAVSSGQPVTVASETTQTHQLVANPNGTLSSVDAPLPVRVQQNGTWVPLSATLTQNSDGTFSPAATPNGVVLSDGGTGPLATLTDPVGNTLSYNLPFTLPAPAVSGSTALYSSVLPGVDLSVSVTDQGGLSDVLIVHSAAAAANPDLAKLTLTTTTQGLSLSTDAEGDLDATATNGGLAYTAPRPVMWDSNTTSGNTDTPSAQALHKKSVQAMAATPADGTSGGTSGSSAAGPGTGAQIAPVAMAVSPGAVVLTPDQTMLTSAGTDFPVFIDPYTNPSSSSSNPSVGGAFDEVYSNSECSGQPMWNDPQSNLGIQGEGVGYQAYGDTCGVGVERTFYTLPITGMPTNAVVSSSQVNATDTYAASWNCSQDQPVTLNTTGSITSSTDWNNQPGINTNYTPAKATVASGENPNSTCSNKSATFDVTQQVRDLVAAGSSTLTVGLFGMESPKDTTNVDFLRFSDYISINTVFDVPPNVPAVTMSPNPVNPDGNGCNNTGVGWVGAAGANGVTLNAKLTTSMGEGINLAANFDVWDNNLNNGSGGATVVDNPPSMGWVAPGGSETLRLPQLQDGHTYGWGVQAEDNASPTGQVSPWISECHFTYDDTPPTTPAVTATDPDFPPLGNGTDSSGYAGMNSKASITVSATDPLPANTCTMGTCQASGIDHFIWKLDEQPTAQDSTTVDATDTGPSTAPNSTATATITAPIVNWGVHTLYVAAVDVAGNISQAPTSYTFYAPWNPATKITPGDIDGDGIPDLLATSKTGDLDLISGGSSPNKPPTLAAPAIDNPTGGTWNDYLIAHRGSLTGNTVDDLYAYNRLTHHLYGIKNDLVPGINGKDTGTAGFTKDQNTDLTPKPSCTAVPATRCAGYDATDWNNLTQITAPGDVYGNGGGFDDLITVENKQLWLYKTVSSPALTSPVLLGDGDWSNFTLISPGTVAGNPTLWARDNASGNLYSFNIAPIDGVPPLLHAPSSTVTPLISGITTSTGGQLCLADPSSSTTDGTDVIIWGCETGPAQSFTLAADNTVHIMGKCLDVLGSGTANNTPVDLNTCNGTGAQTWTNGPDGSLVNPESGKCLADPGAATTPNTNVILWTCDNGAEQNWNSGKSTALPSAPASATTVLNLPTSTYPSIASPGDVNGPISTTDTTGAPDGNPDLYVIDSSGQLTEYPGATPTSSGSPTFASPVSMGTVTNTATHSWTLADGTGTTAADSLDTTAPNPGLDATLTGGAAWNTDPTLTAADPALTTGGNLALDGTTGYATTTPTTANPTGTAVNTSSSYTVSLWANLNTNYNNTDYYTALCQRDASGARCGFYLQYSPAYKGWALVMPGTDAANTSTYLHAGTGITPSPGRWTHLVGVYDATTGTMSLYVNGHLAGTGTDTTPWSTPAAGPLLIGGNDNASNGSEAGFPGKIADVHVYNTALPAADAAALGDITPISDLN